MPIHFATCLGFAYDSPTVEFPVRTGPGTTFDLAPFKISKGTTNLEVLDIQPNSQNTASDLGRVYNWMKLKFPNGQIGWMRGHVIGIVGDYTAWGYPVLTSLVHEYTLTRTPGVVPATMAAPVPAAATPAPAAPAAATPAPAAPNAMQQAVATAKDNQKQVDDLKKESEKQAAQAAAAAAAASGGQAVAPAASTATAIQGTWQPIRPAGPAMARIQASTSSNGRNDGSSVGTQVLTTIPRHTLVPIVAVKQEGQGQRYRWFQVTFNNQNVWVREDNVTVQGDGETLGLQWDLYPAPMGDNRWWIRGWNMPPNQDANIFQHDGWDLGGAVGEPVYCGPAGGVVAKVFDCPKCTPDRPSVKDHGLRVGDAAIFSDEGWGYGYGNHLIISYSHDKLPNSTKNHLAANGFPGGSMHVMYAHLEKRLVNAGAVLTPSQQIATNGNSGNSEGPHVHLEVRADFSEKFTSWASIRKGVMDPVVLFQR